MKSGFESLVWINDKYGKEYVCSLSSDAKQTFEELSEKEQNQCPNVNQIVGTERW